MIWIGALIAWAERRFNRAALAPAAARIRGAAVLAAVLAAALLPALSLSALAARLGLAGTIGLGALASSLLATRLLARRVGEVAKALGEDGEGAGRIDAGRAAVAHLVGREVQRLDAAGVARAALESLAENFSDAVVAPLFWGFLFGLPGLVLYKAANTADSMLGHRTPRFLHFGWAAARFDDALNWIPARLAALLLTAAALLAGMSAPAALTAMRRDAPRHRSPNAGWPEAAMAGALGLALGGPRFYDGVEVAEAWLGEGRRAAEAADIRRGLRLYWTAAALAGGLLLLAALPAFLRLSGRG